MNKAGHTGGRNKTLTAHLFKSTCRISKMERVQSTFFDFKMFFLS